MKGRSYTTALLNVVEEFNLELDENSVAFLVLLDHTKAFGTVNHKIVLHKLRKLFNFYNSAGSLIFSNLLNRCQKVYLNGNISDPLNISRGVPKGSILDLCCSALPDVLVDCRVHMYADDVQLCTSTRKEDIDSYLYSIGLDRTELGFGKWTMH